MRKTTVWKSYKSFFNLNKLPWKWQIFNCCNFVVYVFISFFTFNFCFRECSIYLSFAKNVSLFTLFIFPQLLSPLNLSKLLKCSFLQWQFSTFLVLINQVGLTEAVPEGINGIPKIKFNCTSNKKSQTFNDSLLTKISFIVNWTIDLFSA